MKSKIINYFTSKKEIASVYLFGSFASGKASAVSDVDIGLLFENQFLESAEDLKEDYMMELGRILRKNIEIIIMNRAGEVIINQILKKGNPILVKNNKFTKEFKIRSFAIYSDFLFYLKKMQNGFAKNLMDN